MDFPKNKKIIIALIILLFSGFCLIISQSLLFLGETRQFKAIKVNDKLIKVEVVSNPKDTYHGLSGRRSLCADCGMLFDLKDKREYSFVMREMNFPLDIIFILNNRIVNIYENLPPEGKDYSRIYRSGTLADTVLELNANSCRDFKIKIGDQINFLE